MNEPGRGELFRTCSDMPEWAEYVDLEGRLEAAIPQTITGMAALARVALYSADPEWDDTTAHRLAYTVLTRLCGEVTA